MNSTKKRVRIITIIISVLVLIVIAFAIQYLSRLWMPFREEFQQINSETNTFSPNQENYLVLCQENGIKEFPFVSGGRLSLLSLADGKIYTLRDTKKYLWGFARPSLRGNNVYYLNAWDGSPQGILYIRELKGRGDTHILAEFVDRYALSGNKLFYTKTNDGNLYYKNLKTKKESVLIEGGSETFQPAYLAVKDGVLYYADNENGNLITKNINRKSNEEQISLNDWILDIQPMSDNKVLIATGRHGILEYDLKEQKKRTVVDLNDMRGVFENNYYRYNFHFTDNKIYFYDENFDVYVFDMNVQKKTPIIDWALVNSVQDFIDETDNLSMYFSYCPDFIAVEVEYYNENTDHYDHRIITFNYEGALVLDKEI